MQWVELKKFGARSNRAPYFHHTSFLGAQIIGHENLSVAIIPQENVYKPNSQCYIYKQTTVY